MKKKRICHQPNYVQVEITRNISFDTFAHHNLLPKIGFDT